MTKDKYDFKSIKPKSKRLYPAGTRASEITSNGKSRVAAACQSYGINNDMHFSSKTEKGVGVWITRNR